MAGGQHALFPPWPIFPKVWVMTQIFGSDFASVSVGDSAEIVAGIATNSFTGIVDSISALSESRHRDRCWIAEVVVENPGDFLKKQMYVRKARIRAQSVKAPACWFPVAAILRDDENLPFVYAVQPRRSSFAPQDVTLGLSRHGDQYDIAGRSASRRARS